MSGTSAKEMCLIILTFAEGNSFGDQLITLGIKSTVIGHSQNKRFPLYRIHTLESNKHRTLPQPHTGMKVKPTTDTSQGNKLIDKHPYQSILPATQTTSSKLMQRERERERERESP